MKALIASFPLISIADRHAELAEILAYLMKIDAEKLEATVETAKRIESTLDELVTANIAEEVVCEARAIAARAEVVGPRVEKLVENAAGIDRMTSMRSPSSLWKSRSPKFWAAPSVRHSP